MRLSPLHVTSRLGTSVYVRLSAAMLVVKALNVSLFTNASDYSNKTCMERSMCLYLTNIVVSLEQSLALVSNDTITAFLSITVMITFLTRRPNGRIRKYPNVTSPCNGQTRLGSYGLELIKKHRPAAVMSFLSFFSPLLVVFLLQRMTGGKILRVSKMHTCT